MPLMLRCRLSKFWQLRLLSSLDVILVFLVRAPAVQWCIIAGLMLVSLANPPLKVTNKDAVTIGTQLAFDSPALNSSVPSSVRITIASAPCHVED